MSGIEASHPPTRPLDKSASADDAVPWQFSLREAFWFTTAAGGAAALVRFRGLGSLVLSLALLFAWLNVRGRLAKLQTRRARPKVFYAAWLLLGASLFLPAMKGCNNTVHRGWETASMAAKWEIGAAYEVLVKADLPSLEEAPAAIDFGVRLTLINLANLLALLSPLLLWRLQRDQGQCLGAVLAVSAVAVWATPMGSELLIGCYVWCAGFLALTISYRIGWRLFGVMTLLAAVFAATAA
jgi:hypothetical protein